MSEGKKKGLAKKEKKNYLDKLEFWSLFTRESSSGDPCIRTTSENLST